MQIKRFEAHEIQEALRQVKKEFGPDAVILSIKELEPEGRFKSLLKKKIIEVVAASDANGGGNGKGKRAKVKDQPNVIEEHIKKSLFEYFEHMVSEGVEEQIALEIVKALKGSVVNLAIEDEIKRSTVKILQQKGIQTKRFKLKKYSNQKIAFWGPTGAGKTSTLVKLATAVSLTGKYEVGIITLDSERIGASAQLMAFSQISGIQVLEAKGKKGIKQALSELKSKDLILIDCPGIGQRTSFLAHELADTLAGVKELTGYFVFPAPSKTKDIMGLLEVYGPLTMDGLIVTKMDEAITVGNVLSVAYLTKLPLCYFSSGQEVPGSLGIATIRELVERIFQKKPENIISSLPPEELAYKRKRFELLMEEGEDLFLESEREGVFEEYTRIGAVNLRI